jgi:hypothetical protein
LAQQNKDLAGQLDAAMKKISYLESELKTMKPDASSAGLPQTDQDYWFLYQWLYSGSAPEKK